MPGKAKPRNFRVGAFSKDHVLATLDRRTKAGRVFRTIEAELSAHVGGNASAVQRYLIQICCFKGTRLALLSETILDGRDIGNDGQALAYANAFERSLLALGIDAPIKDVTPSLSDYLATKNGGQS
jgi:hypothetical protein